MKTQLLKGTCYTLNICLVLLFTSCDVLFPDKDKPAPEKKCKIQKINTPWDENTEYTYNAQGRLIKLVYGVSLVEDVEATTIIFEYDANGTLIKAYDNHDQEVYYEYQNGKLLKTKHYSNHYSSTILRFTRDYTRDNKGNITQVLIYSNTNQLQRKYTYTYDGKGNISQALSYWRMNDKIELVSTTSYRDYDNKKNVEPWYFLPGTLTMKNNPGVIAIQDHLTGSSSLDSLTYQYNTAGYPISLQYKHNNEPAWSYQYEYDDCQ